MASPSRRSPESPDWRFLGRQVVDASSWQAVRTRVCSALSREVLPEASTAFPGGPKIAAKRTVSCLSALINQAARACVSLNRSVLDRMLVAANASLPSVTYMSQNRFCHYRLPPPQRKPPPWKTPTANPAATEARSAKPAHARKAMSRFVCGSHPYRDSLRKRYGRRHSCAAQNPDDPNPLMAENGTPVETASGIEAGLASSLSPGKPASDFTIRV